FHWLPPSSRRRLRMRRALWSESCLASQALVRRSGTCRLGNCGRAEGPEPPRRDEPAEIRASWLRRHGGTGLASEPGPLGAIGELALFLLNHEVVELRVHRVLRVGPL